jgi:hypothetical protein
MAMMSWFIDGKWRDDPAPWRHDQIVNQDKRAEKT